MNFLRKRNGNLPDRGTPQDDDVEPRKKVSWNIKLEALLMTRGPTATVYVIFALGTIVMFWWGVVDEYRVSTGFDKYTTVIARGFGYYINFHVVLVLVFASRSFMTFLRRTPLNLVFPFDEVMPKFHVGVGIITVLSAAMHGIFHVIPGIIDGKWAPGFGGWTFSVITGFCLFAIFFIMYITARQKARSKAFERFYYIHIAGAVLGMIMLILHGKLRGVLYTYKWITAPIIVYIFDRVYRKGYESLSYATASGSKMYNGNIFKLTVPKVFEYTAGQYAELKVPSISKLQWHPFTIASAPHEKFVTFYIKETGDWTGELKRKLEALNNKESGDNNQGLRIQIRGPYGAPAEHVGQFESIVLISGGIGATPFLSIVKDAVNHITKNHPQGPPEDLNSKKKTLAPHSSVVLTINDVKQAKSCTSYRPYRDEFPSDSSESEDIVVPGSLQDPESLRESLKELAIRRGFTREAGALRGSFLEPGSFRGSLRDSRSLRSPRDPGSPWPPTPRPETPGTLQEPASLGNFSASVEDLRSLGRPSTSLDRFDFSSIEIQNNMSKETNESDNAKIVHADESARAGPIEESPTDDSPVFWINNVTRAHHFVSGLTTSFFIHWIALARFFMVMLAAATFLGLPLDEYRGFQVLPLGYQVVDFVLALIIFAQAFAAIVLDIWVRKRVSIFDVVLSLPVLVAPVVLHILFFIGIASEVNSAYPEIFYYVMWPLTALVVLVRHFKVVGEYGLLAGTTDNSHADTQSLDFVYTTPTADSDDWLLDELTPLCTSPYFRMHRFLTREKPDVENQQAGIGRFVNNFGRPDWDDIFDMIVNNAPSRSFVGVFFCGPKPMELAVREAATRATYRSRERAWRYRGVRDSDSLQVRKGCSVRLVVKAENFG